MIDQYFTYLEEQLQAFPAIQTLTLTKKRYNAKQGYISGSLRFDSGYRLEFVEVKDMDRPAKVKYRYQYMGPCDECIFRYDNAPHHRDVVTFPHHKHLGEGDEHVVESAEPSLSDVLLEIAQYERQQENNQG